MNENYTPKRVSFGRTSTPIAVLVPKVTLKRRFDFEGAVRGQLLNLARAIEKELNRI